ncbi:acyl-homoserine-lactone synthase [Vibrio sp. Of7-15]|uniref:acyl-homoserine-lactone synthase n=1 Tax=Vibrio sp. Of7-15 TaxID=2724879 RepID=UPI001EF32515|nr:acyl-homoserine-lactone synthase [Vibrio sp. Of7-15]MCG7498105.1 acyl-homoserine-lactone synthase [Vibrio sp. Of7-15]
MSYLSKFIYILKQASREEVTTAQHRDYILQVISDYITSSGNSDLFSEIVFLRKQQIIQELPTDPGNLHQIFTCNEAKQVLVTSELSGKPAEFGYIEKLAEVYFGNILMLWAEYERFTIVSKYYLSKKRHSSPITALTCVKNESAYMSEVVDEIRADQRVFMTHHSDILLCLQDAIVLINLEVFVKEQHWYEMLFCLDLSTRGKHFILYHQPNECAYPYLISTALIQGWDRRHRWLSFDAFFQHSKWQLCLPEHAHNVLGRADVFVENLVLNTKSVVDFESSLSRQLLRTEAVCEVLRLTVSGTQKQRMYHLYLGQKMLMRELVKQGYSLAFTIIELPAMLHFYQSLHSAAYMHSSYQDINKNGLVTFKGFWLPDLLSQQFEQHTFRDYNTKIIKQRRRLKEKTVV